MTYVRLLRPIFDFSTITLTTTNKQIYHFRTQADKYSYRRLNNLFHLDLILILHLLFTYYLNFMQNSEKQKVCGYTE